MNRIAVLIPQELLTQDREWAHDESIEQISEHDISLRKCTTICFAIANPISVSNQTTLCAVLKTQLFRRTSCIMPVDKQLNHFL